MKQNFFFVNVYFIQQETNKDTFRIAGATFLGFRMAIDRGRFQTRGKCRKAKMPHSCYSIRQLFSPPSYFLSSTVDKILQTCSVVKGSAATAAATAGKCSSILLEEQE